MAEPLLWLDAVASSPAESSGSFSAYQRRDPQQGALSQALRRHLEPFLATFRREHPERELPGFVERELRDYLRCGVLAHGFARFRCRDCHKDRLVALSCKGRGFCPRCGGRRMAERSKHLAERVFPEVGVRQWVLSVPVDLRWRLAFDHDLALALWRVASRVIFGWYRRRAAAAGHAEGRGGAVTAIQRFGSALNLNIHFHGLFLDGAYVECPDGSLAFVRVEAPSRDELKEVATTIVARARRLLIRRGLMTDDGQASGPLDPEDVPALASAYADGVRGRGQLKMATHEAPEWDERDARKARVDGFDLHADVAVSRRNRPRLERLCRYILRPPLAESRLQVLEGGRVLLRLKSQWRDGTTHISLAGESFVERLATLVPRPQANTVLYHGVLAANAKWRRRVVPPAQHKPPAAPEDTPSPRRANASWAELMRHSFGLDVLGCPHCGGRLELIAIIMSRAAIRSILGHLGLPTEAKPLAHPPPPPDDEFWIP